jgi:hypothetical protein
MFRYEGNRKSLGSPEATAGRGTSFVEGEDELSVTPPDLNRKVICTFVSLFTDTA